MRLLELMTELRRTTAKGLGAPKWSTARRLATAINQAPGLLGMPSDGHCSRAATRASWARSSARPTSLVIRVSPATRRADSRRQTALAADAASLPTS